MIVEPEFVAQCAVFSRELYFMKDVPALLCAVLAARKETKLLRKTFVRVINDGTMFRNFYQIIRSGKTGRKSFGTVPKELMVNWLNSRTPTEIWQQSVGTPSLKTILKNIHPRPLDKTRSALYGMMVDRPFNHDALPESVKVYEAWKKGETKEMPKTDFRMYTAKKLGTDQWAEIAQKASWFWLLRNLATLQGQGVFNVPGMVELLANRLADPVSIKKASVFPYQIMTAYQNTVGVPVELRDGLERAMEIATRNIPSFETHYKDSVPAYVFTDVSKSMTYPVTGGRGSASTVTRCVDVAALIASCFKRNNPNAEMMFFQKHVVPFNVDPEQSVMANASAIGKIADGGTACWAPLKLLNDANRVGDLLICVSDNQSWCESLNTDRYGKRLKGESQFQAEWKRWKQRNPKAKLVCIDVAPYATTQVQEMKDVLNLGGFSDNVFKLVKQFVDGNMDADHVVGEIVKIDLDGKHLRKSSIEDEGDEE
jgi:60 kDa SS-A/Ro ribonucleoprotein